MKPAPDDLRGMLKDADPARSGMMPADERARMRTAIVAAAAVGGARSWRRSWSLRLAGATAVAALTVLLGRELVAPDRAPRESAPPATSPLTTIAPPIATGPVESVAVPNPVRRALRAVHPAAPRQVEPVPATRILFTAPGGTRILWLAGGTAAREVGS